MAAIMKQARWFAPEVVQTSAMDCGPASLKCLLEGFRIPVSYGRLREACQTSVDGTSIDRIEEVINQLGLLTQQVMLPLDHLFLPNDDVLPAMVVARHPDGATHFIVIWRRLGSWVQVMDPATGRRWLRIKNLLSELYKHEQVVAAADWRDWAASDEFLQPLSQRLTQVGLESEQIRCVLEQALSDVEWYGIARLDAALRLVTALIAAGGMQAGNHAVDLLENLFNSMDKSDIYRHIPISYWSVIPQKSDDREGKQLRLKGAVLLQVKAVLPLSERLDSEELPLELAAALQEKTANPTLTFFHLLREDGLLTPWALFVAIAVSAAAVLLESLLFRGVFDIAWELRSPEQRLIAVLSLLGFTALLLMLEWPITQQALRIGRHFELRLRIALLSKIPRLNDRYFQSRPISDMAERGHSIVLSRALPNLAIQLSQSLWDLLFTLLGITLLDSRSGLWALFITLLAIGLPLMSQALLNERDLRVRSHAGALFSFYLDALLGLVPIRAHSAEKSVRREHEGLLSEWARASISFIQISLLAESFQALLSSGLVCLMLYQHFLSSGGIMAADLLLIYWALKLPAIGQRLTAIAHQFPAQRNSLLRLLEPLASPEDDSDENCPNQTQPQLGKRDAAEIVFENVSVLAGGHTLLDSVDCQIKPGEHIAIVGPSGAGKSTLLGLLLGWHKASQGSLCINGHELNGQHLQNMRQHTAWVDPGIQLWNRSLLDNLTFSATEYDSNEFGAALELAKLNQVVQKLPQGLQTYLGEGGGLLSGGEGQRLRLARALIQRDVQLVLLDEPFRGVDREKRQSLLGEVRQYWSTATLLCVTHDIEETLSFDRVLVVEDSAVIEDGRPSELMAHDSRYRELIATERNVRMSQWQGSHWRRWRMEDARLSEELI